MQVEHVPWICLTPRRTAQHERELAVRLSLLGQIVVNHQRVLALPHEVLGQGGRRIGGDVLHGGWIRGIGGHDDRVLHRAVLAEHLHNAGHLSRALTDRAVDADDAGVLLVDDRIHRDR